MAYLLSPQPNLLSFVHFVHFLPPTLADTARVWVTLPSSDVLHHIPWQDHCIPKFSLLNVCPARIQGLGHREKSPPSVPQGQHPSLCPPCHTPALSQSSKSQPSPSEPGKDPTDVLPTSQEMKVKEVHVLEAHAELPWKQLKLPPQEMPCLRQSRPLPPSSASLFSVHHPPPSAPHAQQLAHP